MPLHAGVGSSSTAAPSARRLTGARTSSGGRSGHAGEGLPAAAGCVGRRAARASPGAPSGSFLFSGAARQADLFSPPASPLTSPCPPLAACRCKAAADLRRRLAVLSDPSATDAARTAVLEILHLSPGAAQVAGELQGGCHMRIGEPRPTCHCCTLPLQHTAAVTLGSAALKPCSLSPQLNMGWGRAGL